MYLHQQLVDNLVLLNNFNRLTRLHSKFTYYIKKCNTYLYSVGYYSIINPNTITKLRYQWCYNYYRQDTINPHWSFLRDFEHEFIDRVNSIYIKTNTFYNKNVMNFAINDRDIDLFKVCIKHSVLPDILNLRTTVCNIDLIFGGFKV